MNIFDSIQFRNLKPVAVCENCAHFQNDPVAMEQAYPGMKVMSSGFASVRDKDGLCGFLELYLSAHDSCPHFTQDKIEANEKI